jgi:excisionase family DNA binding protein
VKPMGEMMMRRDQISLLEACSVTGCTEDQLVLLAESGRLKARRAGGDMFFLREELEALVEAEVEKTRGRVAE